VCGKVGVDGRECMSAKSATLEIRLYGRDVDLEDDA
jgi:hypothetical protein